MPLFLFQGIAMGITYNLSCSILNDYFVKKRMFAFSFVQLVNGKFYIHVYFIQHWNDYPYTITYLYHGPKYWQRINWLAANIYIKLIFSNRFSDNWNTFLSFSNKICLLKLHALYLLNLIFKIVFDISSCTTDGCSAVCEMVTWGIRVPWHTHANSWDYAQQYIRSSSHAARRVAYETRWSYSLNW